MVARPKTPLDSPRGAVRCGQVASSCSFNLKVCVPMLRSTQPHRLAWDCQLTPAHVLGVSSSTHVLGELIVTLRPNVDDAA